MKENVFRKEESVKKLEIGKDYVNVHDNSVIVIDNTEGLTSGGFEGREYRNYLSCSNHSNWREATKEEVIEAFKKHLVHRYGKDWETMEIKERHPSLPSYIVINDGLWEVEISKEYDGWHAFNKNGLLYCGGIWVERLEEPKIHIKEAIKEKTVIHCKTKKEAERILGMAHELGYRWANCEYYIDNTRRGVEKSKTCYCLFTGGYSGCNYYKKNDNTIIPSTQIADLEEKSDKKRYEVIKTTFLDFKQVSLGDNKTNKIIAHFVEQDEETSLLAEKIVGILNLMEE